MILQYYMKGGEVMQNQTAIYLTDNDRKRLNVIKEVYENNKNSDVIRILIKEEYDRIRRYRDI